MRNKRNVTLSTNPAAFDAAILAQADALQNAPTDAPTAPTDAPTDAPQDGPVADEKPADDAPRHRYANHVTSVVNGTLVNGIPIGPRWVNGKCHEAWRMFDALLRAGDGTMPLMSACREACVAVGLNSGNANAEWPRWLQYNGFAKPILKIAPTAPAADAATLAVAPTAPAADAPQV